METIIKIIQFFGMYLLICALIGMFAAVVYKAVYYFLTKCKIVFRFITDSDFLAITPAFNINFHSRSFEIEWIIWSFYVDFEKREEPNTG